MWAKLVAAAALIFGVSSAPVMPPTPAVTTTYAAPIPAEARRWRATLIREIHYSWGLAQAPAPFFGQVHQESEWKPSVRSRFASGLTQFTPNTARDMQGSPRLKLLCKSAAGCPMSPAWALRAMVMYDRDIWVGEDAHFSSAQERLAATLVGYNGGQSWVRRERAACAAARGCDPTRWFGHVEKHCLRAEWACKESRHYPSAILFTWAPQYAAWLRR